MADREVANRNLSNQIKTAKNLKKNVHKNPTEASEVDENM